MTNTAGSERAVMTSGILYLRTAASRHNRPAAVRVSRWLGLAAAPTFALMALLTKIHGGMPEMHRPMSAHRLALGGMCLMYLLMSIFHLGPWLTRLGRR